MNPINRLVQSAMDELIHNKISYTNALNEIKRLETEIEQRRINLKALCEFLKNHKDEVEVLVNEEIERQNRNLNATPQQREYIIFFESIEFAKCITEK